VNRPLFAGDPEVRILGYGKEQMWALKECVADLTIENRLLKKSMTGDGGYEE
jgi:transposase